MLCVRGERRGGVDVCRIVSVLCSVFHLSRAVGVFLRSPGLIWIQEFMAELEQIVVPDLLRACKVTSASLAALYQRFFRSPHFYPWLNSRKELAQIVLDRQVTSLIMTADIHALISNLPVRHAIQMFHSVHQHMARLHSHTQAQESYATGDFEFLRTLQEHRSTILAAFSTLSFFEILICRDMAIGFQTTKRTKFFRLSSS
jgi:hypothetical protein